MDPNYWNDIYEKKSEKEVSWFQDTPQKSLELIDSFKLPLSAPVIDIGGGDSRLVDHLLTRGFTNVSVLDISAASLQKLEERIAANPIKVNLIETDIVKFMPTQKYKLWHDRATFHFLTTLEEVEKYLQIAHEALEVDGFLIISTFSKSGPDKCSGLTITQYSEEELKKLFGKYFQNIKCFEDTHETPWGSKQDFIYCGFKKIH